MADKVVELRKTQEEPPRRPSRPHAARASRARLRLVLLVVIPLIALAVGSYFYLLSGRYISTDNAYVGAQKVLITPDISGKIAASWCRGPARQCGRRADRDRSRAVPHHRDAGRGAACRRAHRIRQPEDQPRLDDAAYRARARDPRSQAARRRPQEHAARQSHRLAGRHRQLADRGGDGEDAARTARAADEGIRNQLLGDPNLPIEKYPPYAQASAALDQAQARSRPHRAARADRRHGDAGREHPDGPLRLGRHAGVQPDRRRQALGRRQPEGNRHHASQASASRSTSRSTRSRAASSAAWSRRSAPAPAHSSRSCRRRTRAETGSRWCSACRCASSSRRTRTCMTCAPA